MSNGAQACRGNVTMCLCGDMRNQSGNLCNLIKNYQVKGFLRQGFELTLVVIHVNAISVCRAIGDLKMKFEAREWFYYLDGGCDNGVGVAIEVLCGASSNEVIKVCEYCW